MLCLSYYCLFLLFNGTEEKHRTGSAWKGEGEWGRVGAGAEGEMTQTMYARVNKWIIKNYNRENISLIFSKKRKEKSKLKRLYTIRFYLHVSLQISTDKDKYQYIMWGYGAGQYDYKWIWKYLEQMRLFFILNMVVVTWSYTFIQTQNYSLEMHQF
jgi:hypothetical protein